MRHWFGLDWAELCPPPPASMGHFRLVLNIHCAVCGYCSREWHGRAGLNSCECDRLLFGASSCVTRDAEWHLLVRRSPPVWDIAEHCSQSQTCRRAAAAACLTHRTIFPPHNGHHAGPRLLHSCTAYCGRCSQHWLAAACGTELWLTSPGDDAWPWRSCPI